jgi:hypothetical protein
LVRRFFRQPLRLAGEIGEDGLGDVPGQVRRIDLPQRGGIDEIRVTGDQFTEGDFVAAFRVITE